MKPKFEKKIDLNWFTEESKARVKMMICSLCNGICYNPILLICGHMYCNQCFIDNDNKCPGSDPSCPVAKIGKLNPSFVVELIREQNCYCKNIGNGCDVVVLQKNLEQHHRLCPKEFIQCTIPGCTEAFLREKKAEHEEICQYQPTSCEKCRILILTKDRTVHFETCEMGLVSCPNQCNEMIIRKDLPSHLTHHCTNMLVNCSYQSFGCNEKFYKKEESEHNKLYCKEHSNMFILFFCSMKQLGDEKIFTYEATISSVKDTLEQVEKVLSSITIENTNNNLKNTSEKEKNSTIDASLLANPKLEKEKNESNEPSFSSSSDIHLLTHKQFRRKTPKKHTYPLKKSSTSSKKKKKNIISDNISEKSLYLELPEEVKPLPPVEYLIPKGEYLISNTVQVIDNSIKVVEELSKEASYHFVLINMKLYQKEMNDENDNVISWGIYMKNIKSWIALGVCIKEVFMNSNWFDSTQPSHGAFVLTSEGYQWHNNSSFKNNKRLFGGMSNLCKYVRADFYNMKNELKLSLMDKENGIILHQVNIDHVFALQSNATLVPCVILKDKEDEILFSSERIECKSLQ